MVMALEEGSEEQIRGIREKTGVPRLLGCWVVGVVSFLREQALTTGSARIFRSRVLGPVGGSVPCMGDDVKWGCRGVCQGIVCCVRVRRARSLGDPRIDRGLDSRGTGPNKLVECRAART